MKGQDQFSSVAQSCLTLCNPMNRSTPGFPVHHQLPELAQTHVHRVSGFIQPVHPLSSVWIQKQDQYICFLQETHIRPRDTYRMKIKGWEKIFHANQNQKKAGVAILLRDKIDFKTEYYKRQRKVLHNDQGFNPRKYNNYKYICTQHMSTSICKANTNNHKDRN